MSAIIKQGYQTEDGQMFDTKAEALDHLRKPLVLAALNKVTEANADLNAWLFENRNEIADTFESTKIRRVTKSEKNALKKALDSIVAAGEKSFAFVADNCEEILDSFRWPSVKRGTEEEQLATVKAGFMALTEDNAELSDWLVASKDAILEAFQAGVVKREVNPKAAEALAAYQAAKKAEKAAAEAAKQG